MKKILVAVLLVMATLGFSQFNASQSPWDKTESQPIYLMEKIPAQILYKMHTENLSVEDIQNLQAAKFIFINDARFPV